MESNYYSTPTHHQPTQAEAFADILRSISAVNSFGTKFGFLRPDFLAARAPGVEIVGGRSIYFQSQLIFWDFLILSE